MCYLPRSLDTQGSAGHDPEVGDLIHFVPWGNLGFHNNTAGIGYDRVIHLGTYRATADRLGDVEGHDVTVAVVG